MKNAKKERLQAHIAELQAQDKITSEEANNIKCNYMNSYEV